MTYEQLIQKAAEKANEIQQAMATYRWNQRMTNEYEGIVIEIMQLVNATGERASRRRIEDQIDARIAEMAA